MCGAGLAAAKASDTRPLRLWFVSFFLSLLVPGPRGCCSRPTPKLKHTSQLLYIFLHPQSKKLEEATRRSERTVALVRSITPESCTSHVTAVRAKPRERTNTTLVCLRSLHQTLFFAVCCYAPCYRRHQTTRADFVAHLR